MADRSNATQALNTSYTTHINNSAAIHSNNSLVQNAVSSTTAAGGIPSFGSSFNYSEYGLQGGQVRANTHSLLPSLTLRRVS